VFSQVNHSEGTPSDRAKDPTMARARATTPGIISNDA
jgi:hypothetical protein